jgi:hypothetical protein
MLAWTGCPAGGAAVFTVAASEEVTDGDCSGLNSRYVVPLLVVLAGLTWPEPLEA